MSPRSHESWKEELPSYLLGALSPGERADLEYHLGGCAECQAELLWLEPAREKLVEHVKQVEPSPNLKRNLMAAVAADLEENPAMAPDEDSGPAVDTASAPVTVADGRGPEMQKNAFKPRKRSWLGQLLRPAILGSMAAVLFAGVILGYAVNDGDSGGSNAPVVAKVLPGKPNAGNADATMVVYGNSGTLKMTNLKKLNDGEVYQAWVQKGQSIEPTASLFTPNRSGTATTSIPDLNGVDVVMVSVEPKGGSEQPTTAPILTIETT